MDILVKLTEDEQEAVIEASRNNPAAFLSIAEKIVRAREDVWAGERTEPAKPVRYSDEFPS